MTPTPSNLPSVEFVLPFYGDPDHLLEAVDSIRAQSDPEWRLTVLDDCYPDPAASAAVGDGDPRITVVRHTANIGLNRNFQASLDVATADYVVFMGGDDRLLPGYVARMRETARRTGADMIQPGVEVIDEHGAPHLPLVDRVKRLLRPSHRDVRVHSGQRASVRLLTGNWTTFPAIAWRREVAQAIGFRPGYDIVVDLALLLDVLADRGTLAVDPAVTFEYRRHSASVSSVQAESGTRFDEEAAFLDLMARDYRRRGWHVAAAAAKLRLTPRLHALLARHRRRPMARPDALS
ncbi:glycosyltransferase family 2 protein [Nocardioides sp. SLBN-35]|uniref:glycosyltransferase family 2 protein n=1 Tax=Nocardioides sp. SLBN-35 TaxID=2768445 RepID=UPI00114F9962|nr:glycosyltransferase family 2 protein [Nocardioides sp. SLBN-35]TQK70596.1 glycosyl transferase family 2 [Nocardioides sp. SLBN-35]